MGLGLAALVAALPVRAQDPRADVQTAYTIRDNVLRVETAEHWRNWRIAVGAATVSADGIVTPTFHRKRVNVAVEGAATAGSHPEQAHYAIDGDPTTAWEPDLDAPPEDWWLMLQLNRAANVDSVVLRFVDESEGQPFRQFLVTGWRRPSPLDPSGSVIAGTQISSFWELFRTDRPTTEERRFAFVPRTTSKANDAFSGDPLEVVHILVTDSQTDRFREVAEGTWGALPAADRGTVDYYRRSASGSQTLTTEEIYRALPPERQGRVRYFRRERPRLAEVEVWAGGDNFNGGLIERGARNSLDSPRNPRGPADIANSVTDGNPTSGPTVSNSNFTYFEDLGTLFWVDQLDFLTFGQSSASWTLNVYVSDGDLAPDGSVLWTRTTFDSSPGNFRRYRIDPTRVRYLRAQFGGSGVRSLTEVMLYGEGYVAEALLTSPMIYLGDRKGLVSIEWDGVTPPGTRLEIATRTGNTLRDSLVYHDNVGNIVDADRYLTRLPRVKKGVIDSIAIAGPDFSDWSRPYARSGAEIQSPRSRRYLQLQARVVADTTSKYGPPAQLHSLTVTMADLYTDEVLAEVWPTRVERVGEPEERVYWLKPRFSNDGQGFDQVRVVATAPTQLDVVDVAAGTQRDFREGRERVFGAERLQRLSSARDTLALQLPETLRRDVELVRVRMRSTVFGHSAAFEAAVKASDEVGAWQLAETGQATPDVVSETDVVVAVTDNRILSELRVAPAVCTPNGDGVNDAAVFGFEVNRLIGEKDVELTILDLAGRPVRRLGGARTDPRGAYEVAWDGTDDDGRRVPPGLYLARLAVRTESARAAGTVRTRTVGVAY